MQNRFQLRETFLVDVTIRLIHHRLITLKGFERGWVAQEQIRLNVMFACVSLLTTTTDPLRLEELFKSGLGDQGYCAEVAVEGLRRLGTPSALATALEFTAKRTWDAGLLGKQKPY